MLTFDDDRVLGEGDVGVQALRPRQLFGPGGPQDQEQCEKEVRAPHREQLTVTMGAARRLAI